MIASLDKGHTHGSIEVGKFGDFVIVSNKKWEHVIYELVDPPIETVIKKGSIIYQVPSSNVKRIWTRRPLCTQCTNINHGHLTACKINLETVMYNLYHLQELLLRWEIGNLESELFLLLNKNLHRCEFHKRTEHLWKKVWILFRVNSMKTERLL